MNKDKILHLAYAYADEYRDASDPNVGASVYGARIELVAALDAAEQEVEELEADVENKADVLARWRAENERLKVESLGWCKRSIEQEKENTAEIERLIVKIGDGQKCVGQWIAEHAKLNRETTIGAFALRTQLSEQAAEIEKLKTVVSSVKQEAETSLITGDETGMHDGLREILETCDNYLGITT